MIGLFAADVTGAFCGRITRGANKKPRQAGGEKNTTAGYGLAIHHQQLLARPQGNQGSGEKTCNRLPVKDHE